MNATTRTDHLANRAPRGGAVSPVNGLFYRGGQWMPMVANPTPDRPAPLAGSSRQVAWAARLRREALARIAGEIHVRQLFLAEPACPDPRGCRSALRRFLIARHALMAERSAGAIIDRRAALAG